VDLHVAYKVYARRQTIYNRCCKASSAEEDTTEDVKHDTRACGPLSVFLGSLRDDGLQINISEKNALHFRK